MHGLEKTIHHWVAQYGYQAVPLALLTDPAGIPWAWILLLLLAQEAKKNVALMLFYGFVVLMGFDHILYWAGALGGPKLVRRICAKKPDWEPLFEQTRENIHRRGAMAIVFGRYLPLVGRWIGLGAGLSSMPYAKFSFYDAISAAILSFGFGLGAHLVGRKTIDNPHFYPIVMGCMIAAIVLSIAGIGVGWWKKRRAAQENQPQKSTKGTKRGGWKT